MLVQCLAEINVAGMEAHSAGPTQLEGGVRNWTASNLRRVERSDCSSDLFGKLMANLQLLGIFTALALGMGVAAPARASAAASPPYSTERSVATKSEENISAPSDLPNDFETIEESASKSGVRQNGGPAQRTVGHTRGIDKLRFDMPIVP